MNGKSGNGHRAERVASVIMRDVSVIVDSLSDPRIHGVTVTDLDMTRDLKYATVFVMIEGNDANVLAALNGCAGYIRRELAEANSEMRGVPQLKFVIDKSQEILQRIDRVIKDLHNDE